MNERGAALLKQMKSACSTLPVITKPADFAEDDIFRFNNAAEDVFSLCAPTQELRRGGYDLTRSPVVILLPQQNLAKNT